MTLKGHSFVSLLAPATTAYIFANQSVAIVTLYLPPTLSPPPIPCPNPSMPSFLPIAPLLLSRVPNQWIKCSVIPQHCILRVEHFPLIIIIDAVPVCCSSFVSSFYCQLFLLFSPPLTYVTNVSFCICWMWERTIHVHRLYIHKELKGCDQRLLSPCRGWESQRKSNRQKAAGEEHEPACIDKLHLDM